MECQKRLLEAVSLASENASEVGTRLRRVKTYSTSIAHSVLPDRHARQVHCEFG
jgi:hypothetical protein